MLGALDEAGVPVMLVRDRGGAADADSDDD